MKFNETVVFQNKTLSLRMTFYRSNDMPCIKAYDESNKLFRTLTTNAKDYIPLSLPIRRDDLEAYEILYENKWIEKLPIHSRKSKDSYVDYYRLTNEAYPILLHQGTRKSIKQDELKGGE